MDPERADYVRFLTEIRKRIETARLKAATAVNHHLLEL
jgi:hypothetical protein